MRYLRPLWWIVVLVLAGCATMSAPVKVSRASPPGSVPLSESLMVVPEPGEVDWAAEQALRATGQAVSLPALWHLRVSERVVVEEYPSLGGYCGPGWGWHGYPGAFYDPWYYGGWYSDPWCMGSDRLAVHRLITWILENQLGQVAWQASARESQMQAPPERASLRLAQALLGWRSGSVPAP